LRAIVQNSDGNHPVLVMGCDAPLIIPEALTWFVDACGDRALDLYLAVVRQETFAAIYPQAKRTWFKTREGRFGSSDLALVRPAALLNNVALTRQLAAHRRDPAALRKALPASLALRAWTGSLSLPEVRDIVQHLVGLQIGIVELPFATVAMDVDTLEDLAAVRYEMAQQRMMRAA
jgi:GTP:adenosylcobinamide-phosphate guanylyltransferase